MNLLPLVERELRVGARQTFTYALRVAGVAALLVVAAVFLLTADSKANIGGGLFQCLHCTLLVAIWVLVPMLTADCISRERREGTLALLFLTPLRPASIVMAKALTQGLRAFTLWLAALPVLTMAFVAGGVGWKEALLSAMVTFSSLCLAMSAGLMASARNRNAARSMGVAGILCVLFVLFLVVGAGVFITVTTNISNGALWRFPFLDTNSVIDAGLSLVTDWNGFWPSHLFWPGWWLWVLAGYAGLGTLALLVSLLLGVGVAAGIVERVWREEPPSARVIWLQRKFTTPILCQTLLHRWLRWELQRNPVGWLERRSWNARLVMWGWTAILICIYTSLVANADLYRKIFYGVQEFLAWLLLLTVAASATGGFRRERETGVLELLLVAPLSERQIIGGRLRGVWGKFLLPEIVLFSLWLYCRTWAWESDEPALLVFFASTFATLPVIGLYYSLARKNLMSAFLWTMLMGIVLPVVLVHLADGQEWIGHYLGPASFSNPRQTQTLHLGLLLLASIQAALAVLFFQLMRHHLKQRKFAML